MEAAVFEIEEKIKNCDMDMARFADFRCGPAQTVDARRILEDRQITLYCLDDLNRRAVFLETPPDIELTRQAFYNQAQYYHAQRVFSVPYEALHELAREKGNAFTNLILIFSVGRCGSTLLSRALDRLEAVTCLDEPDVYMDLTVLRPRNGSRDGEITSLIESCTRLLYRPPRRQVNTLALKFRSFSIELADLFYKAFPTARILFLYRNAETWARSNARAIASLLEGYRGADPMFEVLRLFDVWGIAEQKTTPKKRPDAASRTEAREFLERVIPLLPAYLRKALRERLSITDYAALLGLGLAQKLPFARGRVRTPEQYLEPYFRSLPPVKSMMMAWLSTMDRYLKLHERGIPMLALQYETMIASPAASLGRVFEYCGLPREQAAQAEAVFAEDSQEGTVYSRRSIGQSARKQLSDEQLAQARDALWEHPVVRAPDFIVPNTVKL
ncbi:MAG TPA: hypothetical protein VKV17_01450 [Bryobacteraceae bacterium]|nr:hypothetical protein [Bryobacteraceae bacterium]